MRCIGKGVRGSPNSDTVDCSVRWVCVPSRLQTWSRAIYSWSCSEEAIVALGIVKTKMSGLQSEVTHLRIEVEVAWKCKHDLVVKDESDLKVARDGHANIMSKLREQAVAERNRLVEELGVMRKELADVKKNHAAVSTKLKKMKDGPPVDKAAIVSEYKVDMQKDAYRYYDQGKRKILRRLFHHAGLGFFSLRDAVSGMYADPFAPGVCNAHRHSLVPYNEDELKGTWVRSDSSLGATYSFP